MHILVCDDDAVFAAQMDEYISEWFRAREIQVQSTVCTSGEQLLATPELERYQLAFLDVDLKTTDGIALGRRLRQVAPDIVLVYISAYLEFAPPLGAQSGATGCGAAAGWAAAPHHPQGARPRHGAFQRAGRSAAPWCGVYPELPGQLVPLYLCGAHRQFMTFAPSEYDSFCATQA